MHIEDIFKNRKPNISFEKQLKIIVKVITNYYRWQKSIAKITKNIEALKNTDVCILRKSGYKKMKYI